MSGLRGEYVSVLDGAGSGAKVYRPGGRRRAHGEGSAEEFQKDYLIPAIKRALENKIELIVDLTPGLMGYGSSWLHEVFYSTTAMLTQKELDVFSRCVILTNHSVIEKEARGYMNRGVRENASRSLLYKIQFRDFFK